MIRKLLWKYWLNYSVTIKWPRGWAPVDGDPTISCNSSDPNDWYRWWLEKHAGKQILAWDWKPHISTTVHSPGYEHLYNDQLLIKFHNPKHAMLFMLKFSNEL